MSEIILGKLSEENLISRAIKTACNPHSKKHRPRWVDVGWVFQLPRDPARELCTIFGYDPDEVIR
jgi:hypothetical protein